jgi:hypothetical protein
MMPPMKKPAKKPKKSAKRSSVQTALSVVEQAIGGKLSNGTIEKRKPKKPSSTTSR